MKDSVFNYVHIKYNKHHKTIYYKVHTEYSYYSKRYDAMIVCPVGMSSDGATGALDINSFAWLVHDRLCDTGMFDHPTRKCTNWQASAVCSDVLKRDGNYMRSFTWRVATFLFGGGKARDNSMF